MSDYFDRVERQLVARIDAAQTRRSRFPVRLDHLAVAASVLVVIAVGAVFFGVRGSGLPASRARSQDLEVVFRVSPLDRRVPSASSLERSVRILRQRLDSIFGGVEVSRAGNRVLVAVRPAAGVSRARIVALAVPARLVFYDWEADALAPNGKTVASQLQSGNPAALQISQGSGAAAPGDPGAGGLPLYHAVELASRQPVAPPASTLARLGPQFYSFGAPGSAACAAAARARGAAATAGVHCLLSGPESSLRGLRSGMPAGVTPAEGQQVVVPQGTVVLQAANPSASDQTGFASPRARFYVLKDNSSLSGNAITNPRRSTDSSGSPDVVFDFSSQGRATFQRITAQLAKRGTQVSRVGATYDQHFAVALDQQLATVPSIDFKAYPDGIIGGGEADITGGFTSRTAQMLAALLRYGALSVRLSADG